MLLFSFRSWQYVVCENESHQLFVSFHFMEGIGAMLSSFFFWSLIYVVHNCPSISCDGLRQKKRILKYHEIINHSSDVISMINRFRIIYPPTNVVEFSIKQELEADIRKPITIIIPIWQGNASKSHHINNFHLKSRVWNFHLLDE